MTSDQEQEAFSLVIERHKASSSENDIRTAVQRVIEEAGLATPSEMTTEIRPGQESSGRMDLYIHNTCIEFKKNILLYGMPNPADVDQLDKYIESLLKARTGVRNGILTDGVHYFLRRVGEEKLPLQRQTAMQTFDRPEQASLLREYLHGIISAPAGNISPTAENLERQFGSDSDAFHAGNLLLKEAYEAHRDDPTVAVKRKLWLDLLQVALGKDAAKDDGESDWLFIRHTYITSLIAVIMQQQLLGDVTRYASEKPDALLKGHILAEQSELHGIIDADLFTWPTEVGESAYLHEIARVAERFDWTQNAKEVGPTLYQNVITQEERKRLGEYYTPRWLAKEITETVVDDPLNQRVLDPSCGSGTFIETAVEHILNHSDGLSKTETLKKLQENIIGIDIHPVAVQLAKATWVMAAAGTINAARNENPNVGAITAPIYLGDSMQLRYDTGTLSASQSIELETRETLPSQTAPIIFSIPKELASQQVGIDQLISEIATAIDERRDAEHIADTYPMSDESHESIRNVIDLMKKLNAADRNHVWAYYIRNMIRPAVIAEEKVDRIIGNPPWLTYGQSADIIREELREMSKKRYQIWAGGKLAPHQDIATLFYTRCAELYARPGTQIGMVERRIRAARFPAVKSLDTFDFTAIPSVNKSLVMELARCEYIQRRENIIAVGNSGTGKTHIALGLGLAACQRGMSVGFTTAAALVHELMEARDERRLLNLQRQLSRLNLLIIDELGFVPLSPTGAELLFEVFSQRYDRDSILVTTNLPFDEWTEVFGSERLTGALLDRLTHLSMAEACWATGAE